MKFEAVCVLLSLIITYAFYVAVGRIQDNVATSLKQAKTVSNNVELLGKKVDVLSNDILEIKKLLKREGLWQEKR